MEEASFIDLVQKVAQDIQCDPLKLLLAKSKVHGLKSFQDLFSYIWSLDESHKYLDPKLILSEKSDKKANMHRQTGNAHFGRRDLHQALTCYNMAIINSPHPVIKRPSKEAQDASGVTYDVSEQGKFQSLAVGYSNRSAVLYDLGMYQYCIEDINMAFMYGYPKEFGAKLNERKENCLAHLLKEKEKESAQQSPEESSADDIVEYLAALKVSEPFLKSRVNISKKVRICNVPNKGKGLVATGYLKPGEIIGIEAAYCLGIDPDKRYLYCSYCVKKCVFLLPCPDCTEVVFCSEECRSKSLAGDHWLECKILPTLMALELTKRNLAIKMLKICNYSEFCDLIENLRKEELAYNQHLATNAPMSFKISSDFRAVYHLCTNKDRSSFEFLFLQCQISFVLMKLLLQSERFFVDDNGDPVEPDLRAILRTGAVLLANAIKLHFNPYQIFDLKMREPVASGVFPALSFINHSCYPNMRHYTIGRDLIMRAIRPVAVGEELTIAYTEEFHKQARVNRMKLCEKYHFTCSCEACVKEWPLLPRIPTMRFKCLSCKELLPGSLRLCSKCQKSTENRGVAILRRYKEEVDEVIKSTFETSSLETFMCRDRKFPKRSFPFLCNAIELIYKHVDMPSQHALFLQDMLFKCFEDGC
ncbi:SET and MYND domain-containing protein 4-like [Macrobrachium nipponense]|uniref:SET and MYND domain-containing protein 4-like n=1 Tax=Macrobrachium nipponense TaxID=159736 RepID=UPI0030C7E77D